MSDPFFEKTPDDEAADARETSAVEDLRNLFEVNRQRVFFSRQLEVMYETERFHWITNRALRSLIEEGAIYTEVRQLTWGGTVHLMWHRSYRYWRRAAADVVALVEEYSAPAIGAAIGQQGEFLVLAGFAQHEFVQKGRETRSYQGTLWTATAHDLDFIFERDGIGYGVEVKNTLGYMDHDELGAKVAMCTYLGVRPLFAARMLPKTWANEIIEAGGFALILKYQLYPLAHRELATRVREKLGLPVDSPKALQDGTMRRFVNWHERHL